MVLIPLVLAGALALAGLPSTTASALGQTATTKKPPATKTQKPTTTKKPTTTTKKPTTAKPAPKKPAAAPASKQMAEAPVVACPQVLGVGVGSKLRFCDVMTSLVPSEGIIVAFAPHKGPARLSFDLHNRHTYSEQETTAGRGYAQYTATIGVLTMDGKLLGRGVVQSEFRTARDLLDRISGGAGPKGVKAVAPTGTERIVIEVPEDVGQVSVLGEKLSVVNLSGSNLFTAAQRPIAVVSNFNVEYTPGKPAPATKKPAARK